MVMGMKKDLLRVKEDGSVEIPAHVIKKIGWKPSAKIVFMIEGEYLILAKTLTFREAISRVKEIIRKGD